MITAKIVKVEIDEQGSIRVWANYKIDGIDVQSNYPKIDGESVFCTRYNSLEFIKKTDKEINDYILEQSKQHINSLVRKEYLKVSNAEILTKINSLVGQSVSGETTKVQISPTEEVLINKDGTKGEIIIKDVTPIIGD